MSPDRIESLDVLAVRLKHIDDALGEQSSRVSSELAGIKLQLGIIERDIRQDYIRRDTFEAKFRPVERLVYGLVGLILAAVVAALLALVLK